MKWARQLENGEPFWLNNGSLNKLPHLVAHNIDLAPRMDAVCPGNESMSVKLSREHAKLMGFILKRYFTPYRHRLDEVGFTPTLYPHIDI